jgi:aminopeptidase YwaD
MLNQSSLTDQVESKPDSLKNMTESCLEMTERLLQKYRYRIAGTPECRNAAHEIADHLRESCDNVEEESFRLHPKALWYVGKAVAMIYLFGMVCVALGGYFLYLGTLLCLLGLVYSLVQYVFYGRLFDRAFKSAEGCNVAGYLEPTDAITQQVVLVSHHDSPFIFTFLERFQSIAYIRFLLAMLAYAWLCLYSLTISMQQLLSGRLQVSTGVPLWITIAGLPFAFQLFFMMSHVSSPGAGDNLNSTSMVISIARYFQSARSKGSPLNHTRLILLSTDGEEIGQRGAIQYVQSHYGLLHTLPTFVLNIDSIYRCEDLTVLTRDRNSTCKLSDSMIADICTVANDFSLPLQRKSIPFGGGGTDAAAFAVAGIETVSIIGLPTGMISKGHLYHTSNDVVENIVPAAVKAVLELAVGFIRLVDNRAERHSTTEKRN